MGFLTNIFNEEKRIMKQYEKKADEVVAYEGAMAALSDDEKAMLADVTSSATMSLNDSHGNILAAIKDAYEASKDVDIVVE